MSENQPKPEALAKPAPSGTAGSAAPKPAANEAPNPAASLPSANEAPMAMPKPTAQAFEAPANIAPQANLAPLAKPLAKPPANMAPNVNFAPLAKPMPQPIASAQLPTGKGASAGQSMGMPAPMPYASAYAMPAPDYSGMQPFYNPVHAMPSLPASVLPMAAGYANPSMSMPYGAANPHLTAPLAAGNMHHHAWSDGNWQHPAHAAGTYPGLPASITPCSHVPTMQEVLHAVSPSVHDGLTEAMYRGVPQAMTRTSAIAYLMGAGYTREAANQLALSWEQQPI